MKVTLNALREWISINQDVNKLAQLLSLSGLEVDGLHPLENGDYLIDINLTPNRSDCLSVQGLAREIGALTQTPCIEHPIPVIRETCTDQKTVTLQSQDCPIYSGRVFLDIDNTKPTPAFITQRLEQLGVRSISLIVDIANYVMYEQGEPLHAFDLAKVGQQMCVRDAKKGEQLELLDGTIAQLDERSLVIADEHQVLALAGVMGGASSGVALDTRAFFLECAHFVPQRIAGKTRLFGIFSDGAYRFERGVDPALINQAMARASELILEFAGGRAGPVTTSGQAPKLQKNILLRYSKINRMLGLHFPKDQVQPILERLGMQVKLLSPSLRVEAPSLRVEAPSLRVEAPSLRAKRGNPGSNANSSTEPGLLRFARNDGASTRNDGACARNDAQDDSWEVISPSFRFDISMEMDLIEELARVYGYQHIPSHPPQMSLKAIATPEDRLTSDKLRSLCVARGYHGVITYSFVDHTTQELITGQPGLPLLNPMSSQMDVMRVGLLPGLLQALCYNQNRQQMQVRLFELGLCFIPEGEHLHQRPFIAGVLSSIQPDKHWQLPKRELNFYDLKGDVEALLAQTGRADAFAWCKGAHPALHPGQSALLMHQQNVIGFIGQLHPQVAMQLDLKGKVFVFELQLEALLNSKTPRFLDVTKFPSIRRDLALVVNRNVAAQDLCQLVRECVPELLQEVKIFDVYEGQNIAPDKKSVAMGIVLQSNNRTLNDEQINALIQTVIQALENKFQATIRN